LALWRLFARPRLRARPKQPAKVGAAGNETRYFTAIDGLMDGNADVILKETRQGKTVTAAVLDVCYPPTKAPIARTALSSTSRSTARPDRNHAKHRRQMPVTVKLVRKPTGDTFEFKGQISIGQTVTEVTSTDNSDLSEKEFLRQPDHATTASRPRPRISAKFRRNRSACRVKLDAALGFP
jgi:hypothetical protein